MLVDGPDHAEAVDDFVGDEFGVVAADFAVVEIVVLAAVFYKRGQRGGQFFGLVFGDEVHHVIGDQGGKPADVFARGFQVVGGPDGGGGHHFDFAEIAAGFLCAFADEAETPVDQIRIGELENHTVADTSGGAEGLRAVACDPDAGNFAVGPGKFRGDAIEVNRFAGVQVAEDADKFLEIFESRGFFAEHAAGTVAAADAQFHAPARGQVEGGEQAGRNGDVANSGVCDAGTQAHFFRVGGHEREERKRLLPDHVGIENPAEGKAGAFGLAGEAENAIDGDVRFNGDTEIHGNRSSSVRRLGDNLNAIHQDEVCEKADKKTHEPRVVVEDAQRRNHQADESYSCSRGQSRDGRPIEAARVFVLAIPLVEIFDDQEFFAHDEVIADENAGNGPQKAGVADEPAKNIASVVGHQFPRLHDDAHGAGDEAAGAETDAPRRKIGKIVRRGNDVGGDVDVKRGHEQRHHRQNHRPGIAEAREDRNRIPQRFAKNDQGGGSDGDADEGIESHGRGEAEGLADDLIALAGSVAREIGNVQRDGGPESHDAGERRNEETEKVGESLKFRGRREHWTEAARFLPGPEKERKTDEQQERSGDALQEANGFNAAENHQHIQKPEKEKADRRAGMKIHPAGSKGHDHGVDGFAADPGLNAEPAAGDEGTQNRRNIGAENAE